MASSFTNSDHAMFIIAENSRYKYRKKKHLRFVSLFFETGSQCIALVGLEFRDLPAFASQELGLKAYTMTFEIL